MSTRTWSTCPTCGGLLDLDVIEWAKHTHDWCKCTRGDQLVADYLAAIHDDDVVGTRRIGSELDKLDGKDRRVSLGDSARYYAARWGWPVFPLIPGSKRPMTGHGFKDATTDDTQILSWWQQCPQANIGIATGHAFDVLDVDWHDEDSHPTGAQKYWPDLRDSGELPDVHGVAMTARGGLHVLLQPQGDVTISAGGFRHTETGLNVKIPGIDYRGLGGYVVAAPSRMKIGTYTGIWSWVVRPSPFITGQTGAPRSMSPTAPTGAPPTPVAVAGR